MGIGYLSALGYRATLDALVVAVCKDYFDRKNAIKSGNCTKRTIMEYEYINERISTAAMEIVGRDFEIYIREIGDGRGYARSAVIDVSESSYKRFKREVKINIAKKLHLMD